MGTLFDRRNFTTGTSVKVLQHVEKEYKENAVNYGLRGPSIGYHTFSEGRNIFRIAPAHEVTDAPFVTIKYSNIEVLVDEYNTETQEKTGNKVWQRRKKYNAKVHGPRDNNKPLIPDDPVDCYCRNLILMINEQYKTEKDKFQALKPLNGYWENGQFQWGLKPLSKYACYAWNLERELKLLELSDPQYKQMQSITIAMQQDKINPIDIWSHIDNGCQLIVEKTVKSQAGKRSKTTYSIFKDEPDMMNRESWDEYFSRTKVTDEMGHELMKNPSLKELFIGNYKRRDFIEVVKGLRRFDETHSYDLFSNPVFMKEMSLIEDAIEKYLPEEQEEEVKDTDSTQTETKEKTSTKITKPKMRSIIKEYLLENYELKVEIPKVDPDLLQQWYELAIEGEELPIDQIKEECSVIIDGDDFLNDLQKGVVNPDDEPLT